MKKNIAKIIWDTLVKEMGEDCKCFGTDTVYDGENALLYMFMDDDVEVEVVVKVQKRTK